MPWGAAAAAGASLIGGAMQSSAAKKAAKTAAKAQREATELQARMFDTQNAQAAPYRQSGYNALDAINTGFGFAKVGPGNTFNEAAPTRDQFMVAGAYPGGASGPPIPYEVGSYDWRFPPGGGAGPSTFDAAGYESALGAYNARRSAFESGQTGGESVGGISPGYFAHQFNAGDLNANLAPNWKFALDQGIGATKNAGNLQTGLLSGNTLKGISDYTLNKSGDLYQAAYNNYTANQSNIFNRLSTLAGLGSAANQQSSALAGTLGPSMAAGVAGAGAAQAAGTVGSASAISGALNNAAGWYQMSQFGGTPISQLIGMPGQFDLSNPQYG